MLKGIKNALYASGVSRGQTRVDLPGVIIILVIAGVVGFVGLQVMSTVIDQTGLEEGDSLYNASQSLIDAVDDAWGLLGLAFLVIVLVVIIVYLYGLRGNGGMR